MWLLSGSYSGVFVLLALILLFRWILSRKCTAPGPWGVPLLGYIPFLGKKPYVTFAKLAKEYGDVFQVSAGMQTIVVLNSYDVVVDAYGKDLSFAGRPDLPSLRTFAETGKSRFAFKPANASWRFLRKSALKALTMFASSRNSKLEHVAQEGVDKFIDEIDSKKGTAWDPQRAVFEMVSGIVGSIMFGFEFDPKHPVLRSVLGIQERIGNFLNPGSLMDSIPFGDKIFAKKISTFIEDISSINIVTEEHIANHVYNGPEDDVRDIEDALTKTAAEMPEEEKKELGINDLHIRFISQDLFGAGFATTMDSYIWLLNLTAAHPDVQKKVHQELDRVLDGREPRLSDRNKLAYTEAVIYEAFRFASLIPLGLPHSMQDDVMFRGHYIPKGCTVFANLWAIHHDPGRFPEPHRFMPERFINADGSLNVDLGSKVLSFSTGKRRCVGENLARQELSMLYTAVFQKFEVEIDPTEKVDIHSASTGFTRSPTKYRMIFHRR